MRKCKGESHCVKEVTLTLHALRSGWQQGASAITGQAESCWWTSTASGRSCGLSTGRCCTWCICSCLEHRCRTASGEKTRASERLSTSIKRAPMRTGAIQNIGAV